MRTIVLSLVLGVAGLAASTASAHPDVPPIHKPTAPRAISEQRARERAKQELDRLADAKEIDPSWKAAGRLTAIEKRGTGRRFEWRATFMNDTLQAKKVLYVRLKATGEFVAFEYAEG